MLTMREVAEAEAPGVASVSALVLVGRPNHINFGALLDDVKCISIFSWQKSSGCQGTNLTENFS